MQRRHMGRSVAANSSRPPVHQQMCSESIKCSRILILEVVVLKHVLMLLDILS